MCACPARRAGKSGFDTRCDRALMFVPQSGRNVRICHRNSFVSGVRVCSRRIWTLSRAMERCGPNFGSRHSSKGTAQVVRSIGLQSVLSFPDRRKCPNDGRSLLMAALPVWKFSVIMDVRMNAGRSAADVAGKPAKWHYRFILQCTLHLLRTRRPRASMRIEFAAAFLLDVRWNVIAVTDSYDGIVRHWVRQMDFSSVKWSSKFSYARFLFAQLSMLLTLMRLWVW